MVRKELIVRMEREMWKIKIKEDPIYIPILLPDINCKEGLNTL